MGRNRGDGVTTLSSVGYKSKIRGLGGSIALLLKRNMNIKMNPTQVLDAEPDFQLSAQWQKEIVQRCKEIDCGNVKLLPGEQVFEQAFNEKRDPENWKERV